MAIGWLDVVRFADTIGYHSDNPRNIWPYRDWVIKSFNDNKPFDRFTLEQIAGDLLPDANTETRVGSAFNRLLLTTEEGGAQAKDYEARMLTDRVRAVGAAWLGQTTGLRQCHDHKFDPFTMRDFYSLGAFFADIEEPIIGHREDGMVVAVGRGREDPRQARRRRSPKRRTLEAVLRVDAARQWEADIAAMRHAARAGRDSRPRAEKTAARPCRGLKKDASSHAKEREHPDLLPLEGHDAVPAEREAVARPSASASRSPSAAEVPGERQQPDKRTVRSCRGATGWTRPARS